MREAIPNNGWTRRRLIVAIASLWVVLTSHIAMAQVGNPVYVDDAPRALTVLSSVRELASTGNGAEAVRILQRLLEEEGERVIETAPGSDLFEPVRRRVHATLLNDAELLEQYRRSETAEAQRLLDAGALHELEASRFLTAPGYDATLRLAEADYESARFEAAWLLLRSLDDHPDHRGERLSSAIALLERVAAYVGGRDRARVDAGLRAAVEETLARWSASAGRGALAMPALRPTPAPEPYHSPFFTETLPDMSRLVAHPLPSVTFGQEEDVIEMIATRPTTGRFPPNAQLLYVIPAVSGDMVYINNGVEVAAFNRFTLARKWTLRVNDARPQTYRRPSTPMLEDAASITVDGPWAAAISGLQLRNGVGIEQGLVCIDTERGVRVWSRAARTLPEPALQDLTFRGPLIIDQGTVVVAGARESSQRGLESKYFLGFDLVTGAFKWARPLGSAGAMRHGPEPNYIDMPTARSGVSYMMDNIGFVAAVESATGRVVWIRRMASDGAPTYYQNFPWEGAAPVIVGDRLYTLSPDRRDVICLDVATGELLARTSAAHFGPPDYLLHADGMLIGVGRNAIWGRPIESFDADVKATLIAEIREPGVRGRVVVADDSLVIPLVDGMRIVDARPTEGSKSKTIMLEEPGNILPVESGLIVVDDRQFHPYLVWEVAERILRDRMEARPDDATDAVTLAALAHRAGRPELILPVVDHALRAIDKRPLAASSEKNRARLFRTLLDMIEPPPTMKVSTQMEDDLRESLLDRLGLTARLPVERVAHLMAEGRFREAMDEPGRAVAAYQSILTEPVLARTTYTQVDSTVSAEKEAAARLRRICRTHGSDVYAVFDAEAARLLEASSSELDPEPFEKIARRYPLARVAPRAWLLAAERYRSRDRAHMAVYATQEALNAAEQRRDPDPALLGEIAGRLVTELARSDRVAAAVRRLTEIRAAHPDIVLTVDGETVDDATILSDLSSRLAAWNRRPVIGAELGAPTVMPGWRLAAPAMRGRAEQTTRHIVMESSEDELALWRMSADGGFAKVWGGVNAQLETVLRLDAGGVYFAVPTKPNQVDRNYAIVRRDLKTGEISWSTLAFEEALARDLINPLVEDQVDRRRRFDSPTRRGIPYNQVVFDSDERTAVLVERAGRVAAFDMATGRLLWTKQRTVDRVHDLALGAGVLLLGGSRDLGPEEGAWNGEGVRNEVFAFDARTGQTMFQHVESQPVHWTRIAPDGLALIGIRRGVTALDLFRGAEQWRLEDGEIAESRNAWAFAEQLFVLSGDDWMWRVDPFEGRLRSEPLETRDRLHGGLPWVTAQALDDGRTSVATELGVMIFDESGELEGMNAPMSRGAMIRPAYADDHIVAVESEDGVRMAMGLPVGGGEEELHTFTLAVYSDDTCKALATLPLELGLAPESIEVVDGGILVSAGYVTILIPATPE